MNHRLEAALRRVGLPGRGLLWAIEAMLQRSDQYGTIYMDAAEIAVEIGAKERAVRQALWDLRKHNVIVTVPGGGYRCQYMIDERKNMALRDEIKIAFAKWRRNKNGCHP